MMDFTSRLALNKPNPDPLTGDFVDVSKLNENADKIDNAISFTICTSTARPSAPFAGQAILETDTGRAYVWGGSAWLPFLIGAKVRIDTNLGIGTDADSSDARRLKLFWGGTTGGTSLLRLEQGGAATGSRAVGFRAAGEGSERYTMDFDGQMQWGPGTAGTDITLRRESGGVLNLSQGAFQVGGVAITGSETGGKGLVATQTMNSATYVNITGAPTPSISKKLASTRLRVDMKFTTFSDASNTGVLLGVTINGVQYDVARHYYTTATQYQSFSGFAYIAAGLAAGSYTIQPIWRRFAGTGVLNTLNTISELDVSAREVHP